MEMIRPVLSYEDLRVRAREFLAAHRPLGMIPVPIEEIIEIDLGVSIDVKLFLRDECGVDAFINQACDVIYIDCEVFMHANDNRLRFSLAEELGHKLLHEKYVAELQFTTLAEWKHAITLVPEDERKWIEWQAKSFAALILVPEGALKRIAKTIVEVNDIDPRDPVDMYQLEKLLGEEFQVSADVIHRRLDKDGLYVDRGS